MLDRYVENPGSIHYHYPFVAAVVMSGTVERPNAMTAAWHTQLSHNPLLYGVSVGLGRFTRELIDRTGEFTVNFLRFEDKDVAEFVGTVSGRNVDKVGELGLEILPGRKVKVPVIKKAYAAYECVVEQKVACGDHIFYVGRVVGVHYESSAFVGDFLKEGVEPLLYMGGGDFGTVRW